MLYGPSKSGMVHPQGWFAKLRHRTWWGKKRLYEGWWSMRRWSAILQSLRFGGVRIRSVAHALGTVPELSMAYRFPEGPPGSGWDQGEQGHRHMFTQAPQQQKVSGAHSSCWSQSHLFYIYICVYLLRGFAGMKISVLQIQGLTAFKNRASHTHMACEESFQTVVETLCCYELLLFPDDLIPASYLVTFIIPSAL